MTMKQVDEYRAEYGRDHLPFEYQCMGGEAFSVDGVSRLEELGVDESIIAFRNPYLAELDTETLEAKINNLHNFAEAVIRHCA